MRTILFTGSRGWRDVRTVVDVVASYRKPFRGIVGGAGGFDEIVWQVLERNNLPRLRFKPKWRGNTKEGHSFYNRGAGHARNHLMLAWLTLLDGDGFVIAGWDGVSPGTKGCMDEAERLGITVVPIMYVANLNGMRLPMEPSE